jgi:AcrR family transcriptional regulator
VGRREQAKFEKERRILHAAQTLFKEKGFEATTTKEVAERADIATGTLFLYAKDKNDLLLWVYSQKIARTIEKIAQQKTAQSKVRETKTEWQNEAASFFEPFFKLYADDRATARHFVKEQLFSNGERGMKERLQFLHLLVDYLERGKSNGHVRADVDGRAFAGTLFAVYFIHLGQWLQTGGAIAPRLRELQHHIAQLLQGVY